jgi:2-polyprenyl-3-methyl-5-hydroxy-6-metoxy-1,4-benzoquinol methylase
MRRQHCPNCPQSDARAVFEDANARVLQCRACGLQFAEMYPDDADADVEIYSHDYFVDVLKPEALQARERIFAQVLAQLEGFLQRKGRLLDIGAGEATLVRVALAHGWEAEGTEVSSAIVAQVKQQWNLDLHHGVLEELALPARHYDAVIMNHVLEHVRDPKLTLAKVAQLLRPDGVARIEVPNLAGLSSQVKSLQSRLGLKKSRWKHYSTDHHFWFFTPDTLVQTLHAAGLRVREVRAPMKQWEPLGAAQRLGNALYRHTRWGGHLVAFASPQPAREAT